MASKLLEENFVLTIEDICENCGLSLIEITSYIEEGIIDVEGGDSTNWLFTETSIVQIKKASRLEKDLRLNPAGVALALELMSEIDDLKLQLKCLG